MSSTGVCNLTRLPPEVILQILDYLSREDLRIFVTQLGSRTLRTLALTKYTIKSALVLCGCCALDNPPASNITSALRRCESTPTIIKCITELSFQYNSEHECAPDTQIISEPSEAHPTCKQPSDAVTQGTSIVNILRELTRLETLIMTTIPGNQGNSMSQFGDREKILWHLLCVAAFSGAVVVPAPSNNCAVPGTHCLITEKDLREGPQYLKQLKVLKYSGNTGCTGLVSVLPAFFFPKISRIMVYNLHEEADPLTTSAWLQQAVTAGLEHREGDDAVDAKAKPHLSHAFAGCSNVNEIIFINAWFIKETLEILLLLPRQLKRFSFKHMAIWSGDISGLFHDIGEFDRACSNGQFLHPRDLIEALHATVSTTLEDLRLEYHQMYLDPEDESNVPLIGWLGSFAEFKCLKRLSLPLWMLIRTCETVDHMGMGLDLTHVWELLPRTIEALDLGICFPWRYQSDSSRRQNVLWFDKFVCFPLKHILARNDTSPRFEALREVFLTFRRHGAASALDGGGSTFSAPGYFEFRRWILSRSWKWLDVAKLAARLNIKLRMKHFSWVSPADELVDDGSEFRTPSLPLPRSSSEEGFFPL